MEKNYFVELNSINVNDKTEKKGGLTYLSWSFSWGEVKKHHPAANYKIYENADGWNYFTDGRTCWVKTGVIIEGIEHIEYLPVMDFKNNSIPLEKVTSFDVNKAIQRSLTKAAARHGLGLYIYAGEDLPDGEEKQKRDEHTEKVRKQTIGNARAVALGRHLADNGILATTVCSIYKVKKLEDLNEGQHQNIIENISKIKAVQDGAQGETA